MQVKTKATARAFMRLIIGYEVYFVRQKKLKVTPKINRHGKLTKHHLSN